MNVRARRARIAAFYCLVVPALMRTLMVISSNPYFAMDPREFVAPLEGAGPMGAAILDAISILGLCLALAAEYFDKRAPDYKCLILGVIPLPMIFWHAAHSADDMFIASGWLSAIATGLGALHLARDGTFRRLGIAVAAAVVAPLVIKGIYQVTLEHAATVEAFNANRDAVLQSRGWEPGSPEAEMFVRRLTQREATGWFALSNVYGSLLACLATFWITTALNAARSRASGAGVALAAIFAVGTMVGLAVSFSKGAIAAGLVGIVLAGLSIVPASRRRFFTKRAALITVLLIVGAVGATIVRGALIGPDGFNPDGYSLLFRWQYWLGAARMFAQHPLTGVGPAGFQDAYILLRPALSPEEVAAAHNVFIEWLSTLGITGVAWLALSVAWLGRIAPGAARTTSEDRAEDDDRQSTPGERGDPPDMRRASSLIALCAFLVIGSAWFANRNVFNLEYQALLAPLSILIFIAAGVLVWTLAARIPVFLSRWALWAALTVALVHSQIEVTLTQPGSASLIFLLIGLAAARSFKPVGGDESVDSQRPAVPWALAGTVVVWLAQLILIVRPTYSVDHALSSAYAALEPVGEFRQLIGRVYGSQTLDEQVSTLHDVQIFCAQNRIDRPIDRMVAELQSHVQQGRIDQARRVQANIFDFINESLETFEHEQLDRALDQLARARAVSPPSFVAWKSSMRYEALAAQFNESAGAAGFDQSVDLATRLVQLWPHRVAARAIAMQVFLARFERSADSADLDEAITQARQATILDPHGISAVKRLAELLDRAGRRDQALETYAQTLANDENMRLDPLKQLSASDRRAIERRMDELRK